MAPEESEKTAARGQGDRVVTDMVLNTDNQCKNQGQQEKQDINGNFFVLASCYFGQNYIFCRKITCTAAMLLWENLIQKNAYSLTQESVGQTDAHWGSSKWPLHSTQVLGSIT